ncbi:MAG: crossover junction endodeoxyribonuclease RuvC, partial [Patescibacteria group bacterium]
FIIAPDGVIMEHMITILGVDPGTARIGWGVIEDIGGNITAKAYGCITTDKIDSPEERLAQIYTAFTNLLTTYKPDAIGVEDLYFAANAKTAIAVGQARGVILLATAQAHIPVSSYSPMTVKKTICGSGSAEKAQVGKMVTRLLHLEEMPKPDDTADALAIAVTHGFSYKLHAVSSSQRRGSVLVLNKTKTDPRTSRG